MRDEREDAPRPDDMMAEGTPADDALDPLEKAADTEGAARGDTPPRRTGPPPEAEIYRDIQGDRVGG